MTLRFTLESVRGRYDEAFTDLVKPIARAATATMDDAKADMTKLGRGSIAAAGFSKKWQNALRVNRYPKGAAKSIDAAIWIYHKISYAGVFEDGARIAGSPLLWLPLPTTPKKIGGRRVTAGNFESLVGPLFSMKSKSHRPLLGTYMRGKTGQKPSLARLRAGGALARLGVRSRRSDTGRQGLVAVPVFIGVSAVDIHKRFDIGGAFDRVRRNLGANYLRHITAENAKRRSY